MNAPVTADTALAWRQAPPRERAVLVRASGVGLDLGGGAVLDGVDLMLSSGEIVTLIGPNGAGKTTLAELLLGLLAPTRGNIARAGLGDRLCAPAVRSGFMPLIAFTVAVSIKIVGILLITSLLIIPAATARVFASSPERMVAGAVFISIIAVLLGLGASLQLDTPAGPSIVLVLSGLFALTVPLLMRQGAR